MSSYIAFDLDALNKAPSVARAAGLDPDAAIGGLARLWEFCWRTKTDTVTRTQLKGLMNELLIEPLVAFGFLDPLAGKWRVKGAERYLRVSATRSENGKKAARNGNLKKGSVGPTASQSAPTEPQQPPSKPPTEPQQSPNSSPVLTANSEQRASNSEQRASKDLSDSENPEPDEPIEKVKAPKEEPDARLLPLTQQLEAIFKKTTGSKYKHGGAKDALALKRMLGQFLPDEITRRWQFGLRVTGYKQVATFAQLDAKWNDLAIGSPVNTRAPIAAETIDWTKETPGEVAL